MIAPFAPRHAAAVLDVIGAVFGEYGATFDPDGFDADLRDIEGHYAGQGGRFVVLEVDGRVVGTAAVLPRGHTAELKRVYLLPEYRGRGYGRMLVEDVLAHGRRAGCVMVEAWSDARFTTAHAVYERMGFQRFGERTVDDIDGSREIGFRRSLVVV